MGVRDGEGPRKGALTVLIQLRPARHRGAAQRASSDHRPRSSSEAGRHRRHRAPPPAPSCVTPAPASSRIAQGARDGPVTTRADPSAAQRAADRSFPSLQGCARSPPLLAHGLVAHHSSDRCPRRHFQAAARLEALRVAPLLPDLPERRRTAGEPEADEVEAVCRDVMTHVGKRRERTSRHRSRSRHGEPGTGSALIH